MSSRKYVMLTSIAGMAITSVASAQWTSATITSASGDVVSRVTNSATLPTLTTSGASSFTADFRTTGAAGTDHSFTNWWWYRANGDTRERAISAATAQQASIVRTLGTDSVMYTNIQPEATGINANLRFELSFSVVDLDGPGGNRGRMSTTLSVVNTGTTVATNVNLYHYFDYFFTGEDAGDLCATGNSGVNGSTRYVIITDPSDTTSPSFNQMMHEGIGANAYTVGSFTTVGGQMGDTNIDNFSDLNAATTAGDQSGVMQWSFGDIPAGGRMSAEARISIVPAPASLAVLGMGALIPRRRR